MYPSSLGLKKFPKRYVTRGGASKLKRYVCVTRGGGGSKNAKHNVFIISGRSPFPYGTLLYKIDKGGFYSQQ